MKIILERNLDFRQFQNLFILTFITVMLFLGMVNSVDFKSYYLAEMILLVFNLIFITVLFTKKGLVFEDQKLFSVVFLFGIAFRKRQIITENFQRLSIMTGKLSTNYHYSYDIKEFHNWEPNLNHSVTSFTLYMINQENNIHKKIRRLTKPEKVKLAINFIIKNTTLMY